MIATKLVDNRINPASAVAFTYYASRLHRGPGCRLLDTKVDGYDVPIWDLARQVAQRAVLFNPQAIEPVSSGEEIERDIGTIFLKDVTEDSPPIDPVHFVVGTNDKIYLPLIYRGVLKSGFGPLHEFQGVFKSDGPCWGGFSGYSISGPAFDFSGTYRVKLFPFVGLSQESLQPL